MAKLAKVLVLALALNFLLVAGGVGWLWRQGRLDRQKVLAIKELVYPPAPATEPATRPASDATEPAMRLEELLARHAGLPAAEQLQLIRQSFDAQMAQLDRRHRELVDLRRQVESEKEQVTRHRAALEEQRRQLEAQTQEAARQAEDEAFQASLELYQSMPPRQVKSILLAMEDEQVARYLRAMDSRTAARIAKEFKTEDEMQRLKQVMERFGPSPATQPS